jgi:hypothetical protein
VHILSHFIHSIFSPVPFSFHRFFKHSTWGFLLIIMAQSFSIPTQSFRQLLHILPLQRATPKESLSTCNFR